MKMQHHEIRKTHKKVIETTEKKGKHTIWEIKAPSPIFKCSCGIKYLKTRREQDCCLACFVGSPVYSARH